MQILEGIEKRSWNVEGTCLCFRLWMTIYSQFEKRKDILRFVYD